MGSNLFELSRPFSNFAHISFHTEWLSEFLLEFHSSWSIADVVDSEPGYFKFSCKYGTVRTFELILDDLSDQFKQCPDNPLDITVEFRVEYMYPEDFRNLPSFVSTRRRLRRLAKRRLPSETIISLWVEGQCGIGICS